MTILDVRTLPPIHNGCRFFLIGLLLWAISAMAVAQTGAIRVEAEDYLWMSGVETEPTSDIGGGLNVGWIDAGDWMSYGITFPCSGEYDVSYRVASNTPGGGRLRIESDSGTVFHGTLDVPYTGGWQNWTTITHRIHLPFSSYKSLAIGVPIGGWNLNWFELRPVSCNNNSGGITAQLAASEMGKGFNLGQMFENDQHPRTFAAAKAKIDAYYAKGFRTVRIPITWTDTVGSDRLVHDPNQGNVNFSHPRLQVITEVVDYALSQPGLYVVINAHHERQLKHNNRWWVLERLWQDIADIFKNRNHRLLYQVLNEPHREDANKSPMAPADLRFMTGKAYDKIRAVDPHRIIIIGGNQWFNYHEMAVAWPHLNEVGGGSDPYVMASFHHYNPWSFSGNDQGSYDDPWTNHDLANPMDVMNNWANTVGQGMPVYISEWGVGWGSRYSQMQCNNIRLWYQMFYHDMARHKSQPATVWDDGGWFKVFDHGTNSFNNNLADCISGSCDWDGSQRFNSGCW